VPAGRRDTVPVRTTEAPDATTSTTTTDAAAGGTAPATTAAPRAPGATAAAGRAWRLRSPRAVLALGAYASGLAVASVVVGRSEAWDAAQALHHEAWAVAAVAAVAAVSRRLGAVRAVALATVSAVVAVAVVGPLLLALASLGEVFAEFATEDSLWAPFAGAAGVLVVAGRRLGAPWDRTVPLTVVTTLVAAVAFRGHAAELVTLAAVGVAALLGRFTVPRVPRPRWQDADADRARTTAAALLGALALGLALGSARDADGVLAPVVAALGPVATPAAVALLLVATAAVLRGRRAGLVVAVVVLAAIAAVTAWEFTVDPVREGWLVWSDVPFGDLEWEVSLLLLWVAPLVVLVLLVRGRQAFVRRSTAPAREREHDALVAALEAGDAGTLGWMGTWEGTSTWFADDGSGAVAYRACNGIALTVSDPVCAPGDAEATIRGFARECSRLALTPVFYSVHDDHRPVFESLGWSVTQVAEESVLDLATFTLSGKKRTDLRTAVNRAGREGVEARWSTWATLDEGLRRQVVDLSQDWVSQKELPEMGFTLGGLPEMDDPAVRLLLAVDGTGHLHGVTSWLPVHRGGRVVGLTLDVMRRGGHPMPGVMEFLIARAALDAAAEGLEVVSLSGTPLARSGGGGGDGTQSRLARLGERAGDALGRALEPAYGFSSLARFKGKFQPRHRPLLMAYPTAVELPVIGRALVTAYVPSLRFRQVLALVSQVRQAGQERRAARRQERRDAPRQERHEAGRSDGHERRAPAGPRP